MLIVDWQGTEFILDNEFCARVYNPKDPGCPVVGQVIRLHGHRFVPNGQYLVTRVVEIMPSVFTTRDIRVSLLGELSTEIYSDLNAANVVAAMEKDRVPLR